MSKFCTNCGAATVEGARCCIQCGHEVAGAQPPPLTQRGEPEWDPELTVLRGAEPIPADQAPAVGFAPTRPEQQSLTGELFATPIVDPVRVRSEQPVGHGYAVPNSVPTSLPTSVPNSVPSHANDAAHADQAVYDTMLRAEPTQAPTNGDLASPATIGQRLLARLVDGLISALLGAGMAATMFLGLAIPDLRLALVIAGILQALLLTVILYNVIFRVGRTGQSWGKLAVGVAVVDTRTGLPIGSLRVLAREVVYAIPLIGVLSPLFDSSPWKRGLPDQAVTSSVISVQGVAA